MTSLDVLQTTFRCDRFGHIPVRGCLRRQLDRDASSDSPHPPRRPYCAGHCAVGLVHRQAAEATGMALGSCPGCGDALVGIDPETCPTCAARRLEARDAIPRGFLPAHELPPPRSDIPDVPFTPPRSIRADIHFEPLRAVEDAGREPEEQDHQEEPAEPAQETEMPPKSRADRRTCSTEGCTTPLRSDNSTGRCSRCQRMHWSKADRAATKQGRTAPAVAPAQKPRRATREFFVPGSSGKPGPAHATATTAELLDLRASIDQELGRRLADARAEVAALEAAVAASEAA
jgi:hypothetical protein